jgi:hypothetical protein
MYYAFDVLMWKGQDLQTEPLYTRRQLLETQVMPGLPETVRYWRSFDVPAQEMISAVRSLGFENVIAKRMDSLYEPGKRTGAWVKMRIGGGQEFVIGGYTPSAKNFNALVVGYYEGNKLMYAARVRTGSFPRCASKPLRVSRGFTSQLAVCESSRSQERPVGRRAHSGRHGEMLMAAAGAGGSDRVRGMDALQSSPPFEICGAARGQRRTASRTRAAGGRIADISCHNKAKLEPLVRREYNQESMSELTPDEREELELLRKQKAAREAREKRGISFKVSE